ncbi:hypothetical protein ZWY2020_033615 [Hordeum vulgare]|nr:hypothetical protein ZWY2020_033615 [Hordeum vulgare]
MQSSARGDLRRRTMRLNIVVLYNASSPTLYTPVATSFSATFTGDVHVKCGCSDDRRSLQRHGLMLALSLGCNWLGLESDYIVMEADINMKEGVSDVISPSGTSLSMKLLCWRENISLHPGGCFPMLYCTSCS